ncbi:DUF6198 family protein [Lactobacillus sp. Sy-1]|uniref:DUF6198 family protein n=1 Tax=Lactobacillus sp. Sy-1 TaxID=2109645 RepID=UPI001C5B3444|nr:DUF6198 family protein [Lactobacillus sp. Sy-1]MBW1605872.1 hypothetical protein [Lactobacillus sp. Sy-1]
MKLSNIIIYLIGLNILAIGTVLFKSGRLGVSALVSVPQIISLLLPITLGQATTYFFIILIIIELLLIRKIKLQILLQLVLAFIFGSLVDFYGITLGMERLLPVNFTLKALVTLAAIVCTSVGIFMMVKMDLILIPPDGLVHVISGLSKRQFGMIKFCFDLSTIVISLVLSFVFFDHIEAIGIGTVAAVLLVGQLINVWERLVRRVNLNFRS